MPIENLVRAGLQRQIGRLAGMLVAVILAGTLVAVLGMRL